jgi:toxin ParE1/3/4
MGRKKYKLRFLPLFENDLNDAVDYIARKLKNPDAADTLVDEVQKSIHIRADCAESFEQYHSVRERQYPYYRIYIRNYIVFYVVIDDVMEVRRLVYNGRNITKQV